MKKLLIILLVFYSSVTFPALSDAQCATLIVTNLKALNEEITGEKETELIATWTEICKALIAHIQASAVVTVTGVTSGSGTATGTVQ